MAANKLFAILLCPVLLLGSILTAVPISASESYTVAQVQSLRDGIVASMGYSGNQDFIDNDLCGSAGISAEFYVMALSQSGEYRFSGYESALLSYLDSHDVGSAASREKYALALAAIGSTDRYITDTADEAIGGLGIMSLIFGLHLLNNGYDSALYSTDGLVSAILSKEKDGGGWAVVGSSGDVDVTAMTIQALAPHYGGRSDVTAAVDRAVSRLSDQQLDSGGFKTMGAENSESAAQVIMALSSLGIDAQSDGRFIKNGNSAMDGMMQYRLSSGGFSHDGGGANATANEEAYCALTAYLRMRYGQSGFYLFDHVRHGSSGGEDSGFGSSGHSGNSGNSGSNRNDQSGGNTGNSGGSDRDAGGSEDVQTETDSSGNRIIIINGQRFIESTNAAGEPVTINISETEAPQKPTQWTPPEHGSFQPDATADSLSATADQSGTKGGYKFYAILGIVGAAGIVCAVLLLLKKRNKKHYIAVTIIAAAGIVFVLLTNFESVDSYHEVEEKDGDLTVTMSIRCDTVKEHAGPGKFIPTDGVILEKTTFSADEGDTVYDVLLEAAKTYHIELDNRGAEGAAYIAGINQLNEFDFGELSGWMYRVNGAFPDVGCQSYSVSDGDEIEWLYTTNIGKDL